MADLKQLFHDYGFSGVKTYIQSGNVLFETEKDKNLLTNMISNAFAERFGFQSPVVLRASDEISEILSALPFTKEEIEQVQERALGVEHVYVFLSNNNIETVNAETLLLAYDGKDKLSVSKREIYLLCYHSIRDSKLATSLLRLDTTLTSRNHKTMLKTHELLGADRSNNFRLREF